MRVLIVELHGRGGFWHYAAALSNALARLGVATALATVKDHEKLPADIHGGVATYVVDQTASNGDRRRWPVWRALDHARKLARFGRLLAQFRPEIVHFQGSLGQLDFLYFKFVQVSGARVVYTAHNPRPRTGRGGRLDRARYERADAVVVLTSTGAKDLAHDGIAAEKIILQPHGNYLQFCANAVSAEDAKRAIGIPADARIVLFFGGIADYKGLDVLIDAFAHVRTYNPRAHLLIAGRPEGPFDAYARQIAGRGISDAVTLRLGYVPLGEISPYFCAADVVALPYRRSYQSGVLQLAYGFARPVVVTDASALGTQVSEDGTGLVATLDPRNFGAALTTLLEDEPRAAAMGKRGWELAGTKYSWDEIARHSFAVYRRLLNDLRL